LGRSCSAQENNPIPEANNSMQSCSGYYYDDTSIMGFTHTHLSGTGIGDYGDILFMPVVGEKPLIAGTAENPDEGYRSRFSHEQRECLAGILSSTVAG